MNKISKDFRLFPNEFDSLLNNILLIISEIVTDLIEWTTSHEFKFKVHMEKNFTDYFVNNFFTIFRYIFGVFVMQNQSPIGKYAKFSINLTFDYIVRRCVCKGCLRGYPKSEKKVQQRDRRLGWFGSWELPWVCPWSVAASRLDGAKQSMQIGNRVSPT